MGTEIAGPHLGAGGCFLRAPASNPHVHHSVGGFGRFEDETTEVSLAFGGDNTAARLICVPSQQTL